MVYKKASLMHAFVSSVHGVLHLPLFLLHYIHCYAIDVHSYMYTCCCHGINFRHPTAEILQIRLYNFLCGSEVTYLSALYLYLERNDYPCQHLTD